MARDDKKIFEWCNKSAQLGNPLGMLAVAALYDVGVAGQQNRAEALEWRRKAAAANFPQAMFLLGRQFESGDGVPKDDDEALRWFRKGAMFNDPAALTVHWLFCTLPEEPRVTPLDQPVPASFTIEIQFPARS